jgi:multimeric flavodoxin WrbA
MLSSLGDEVIERAVRDELRSKGVEVRVHDLTHERFAPCLGCFECWVAHPGTCKANDNANDVMRDVIASDAVLWLVAPRFGAWDPVAKAALDKVIGLISPFFTTIAGETHHRRRYERYPRWAVLAVSRPEETGSGRELFRTVVERNVLNMQGHSPFVEFVESADPTRFAEMADVALAHVMADLPDDGPTFVEPLPPVDGAVGPDTGNRRAVLWVGSAKPHHDSTSEALGAALTRRLESRGWECSTVHAAKVTKLGRGGSPSLVDAARRASLLIVASPVYVDCLPALVLKGLGDLVDAAGVDPGPAILPIVQCGFPEATHTRLAVEVVAQAAACAGWAWAGHLAFGAGGFISGADIDASGRFHKLQRAFDEVADALDAGDPVPADLTVRWSVPLMNPAVYRRMGDVGWLYQAIRNRAVTELWQRPFASNASGP